MDRRTPGIVFLSCLLAVSAAFLAGCGSSSNDSGILTGFDITASDNGVPLPAQNMTFWAHDFSTGKDYQVQATRVGVGSHCYVYLEQGNIDNQAVVNSLIQEFDGNIYPSVTAAFGSEPNPGIDADPKIYILLLDIRDTYNRPNDNSYVAGYFYSGNEVPQSLLGPDEHSNEKEMIYIDTYPAVPGSLDVKRTFAHEFQHMIHFNVQETHKGGIPDSTWLNEAMSTIAPGYCNYIPDYLRVAIFEAYPADSLTLWGNSFIDYGIAYMWAQYVKDRVVPSSGANTIFWRILHDSQTGIASVNDVLTEIGYGKDFRGVFRDWAVAAYSGNALSWKDHTEWSYTSINTWPGIYPIGDGWGIELFGLFSDPALQNVSSFGGLAPWSFNYYLFTPTTGGTGSVTWTRNASDPDGGASIADNTTIVFDMLSGMPYTYTGKAYVADVNPSDSDHTSAGDSVSFSSLMPRPTSAREMLEEAGRNPTVRRLVAATGRPFPVCVHPYLEEKMRLLRAQGIRPLR